MNGARWWAILLWIGLIAGCETVDPAVLGVSIAGGHRTLAIGGSVNLSASVEVVGNPDRSVTWSTSAADIASVTAAGRVSGVAVGVARITATSVADTSKSATVEITVTDEPIDPDPVQGVRFDFTDAVGLQLGAEGSISTANTAGRSSGLVKVMSDGRLMDALADGAVTVRDFFVRNGKVYVLFGDDPTGAEGFGCVLGEVDRDGDVFCVDPELRTIEIGSIKFDAHGGIYYRGTLDTGNPVIRRSVAGTATDYYRADDVTSIHHFTVTRDGMVIASGASVGAIGRTNWIRLLGDGGSVIGRTLDQGKGYLQLYDFLPDGTILAEHHIGEWETRPRRLFVDGGDVRWDAKYYVDWPNAEGAATRFQFDDVYGFMDPALRYTNADAMFGITSRGLLMMFPEIRYVDIPIDAVTNADIRANVAAVSGTNGNQQRALLVDLDTEVHTDMLDGRDIEVLRLLLQLDRERVVFYGLDISANRAVLGEYDIRAGSLTTVPVEQRLAESFVVLDWRVDHVPPSVEPWIPDVDFRYAQGTGLEENHVGFMAEATSRPAFIDRFEWDFGDGTTFTSDTPHDEWGYDDDWNWVIIRYGGAQPVHVYEEPGIYEVSLTLVNDIGNEGRVTQDVQVGFSAPEPAFTHAPLSGWDEGVIAFDATAMPGLDLITHFHWDFGDGTTYTSDGSDDEWGYDDDWNWVIIRRGGAQPHHRYAADGTYDVTLSVTNFLDVTASVSQSIDVPAVVTVGQAAAGTESSAVLLSSGDVFTWGHWPLRSASTAEPDRLDAPTEAGWKDLDVGSSFGMLLDANGTLFGWGYNENGQLGNDDPARASTTVPVRVALEESARVVAMSAGAYHALAVTDSGAVFGWGENGCGTADPSSNDQRVLAPSQLLVDGNPFFVQVAAGSSHNLALTDEGKIYAWGCNYYGQVGHNNWRVPTQIVVPDDPTFVTIVAGSNHSLALTAEGRLYVWGLNDAGQIGDGTRENATAPVLIDVPPESTVQHVAAGGDHTLAITSDGALFAWGNNADGGAGLGAVDRAVRPTMVAFDSLAGTVATTAGAGYTLFLTQDGRLYAVGRNWSGQLGDGTTQNRTEPVRIR